MAKKSKYLTWLQKWRKKGSRMHPEHMDLKIVYWVDAASHMDEPTKPIRGLVAGWLKDADESAITLAMEVFEDHTAREFMAVPAGIVLDVMDVCEVERKE